MSGVYVKNIFLPDIISLDKKNRGFKGVYEIKLCFVF
jgi:hypothetical protein